MNGCGLIQRAPLTSCAAEIETVATGAMQQRLQLNLTPDDIAGTAVAEMSSAKHPVNTSAQKYSYLPNFGYSVGCAYPARHKGRFAIVTRRGQGGGGRDCVGAHFKLQGGTPSRGCREQGERGTTRR